MRNSTLRTKRGGFTAGVFARKPLNWCQRRLTPAAAKPPRLRGANGSIAVFSKENRISSVCGGRLPMQQSRLVPRSASAVGGFTLVEMIVAVGIFSIMIVAMMSVLLSIVTSSSRAEAQQTAVDNLSFTLDSVSRRVRYGFNFYCTDTPFEANELPSGTRNCEEGSHLVFTNVIGESGRAAVRFNDDGDVGRLEAVLPGSSAWVPLTSDVVDVNSASFTVVGAESGDAADGDGEQAHVHMLINAIPAGQLYENVPEITVQTTMTQRLLDAITLTTSSGGGGSEDEGGPTSGIVEGNRHAAGNGHTVAIKSDDTLWAWGYNAQGQLGIGGTSNTAGPVQVGTDTDWALVTTGWITSGAIKEDGTLWLWGYNSQGQLGLGDTTLRDTPTQVGSDTDWARIEMGSLHSVAIKTDGTLWATGGNNDGQLGLGDTVNRDTFEQVGTATDWSSVVTNRHATFAIKEDGTLYAWGLNDDGQLGLGDTTSRDTPTQVGTDTDWARVAAGAYHTLAIKTDGTLYSWGENFQSQLGLGDFTDRTTPTQVGTDTDWASIAAGSWHSLALKTNNTLRAWGYNGYGQLGLGDTGDRSTPTQVGSDTDWVSVSVGTTYTLAEKSDGTFYAWGRNQRGQLGLGDTTDRDTPTQVPGVALAAAILPERLRKYV